jgi:hypothetical protein
MSLDGTGKVPDIGHDDGVIGQVAVERSGDGEASGSGTFVTAGSSGSGVGAAIRAASFRSRWW